MALPGLKEKFQASAPYLGMIYGPPGIGKTLAALSMPSPVIFAIEDKIPQKKADNKTDLLVDKFTPTSYTEFQQILFTLLGAIEDGSFECDTLVIDSADKLEQLIWADLCERNSWENIASPGYGDGYTAAQHIWFELLADLRHANKTLGVSVILISHSEIKTMDPPDMESYSRYAPRLNAKAGALIIEEVDWVGFLCRDVSINKKDGAFGKEEKTVGGAKMRRLWLEDRPAASAKNTFGAPSSVIIKDGVEMFEVMKDYLT